MKRCVLAGKSRVSVMAKTGIEGPYPIGKDALQSPFRHVFGQKHR
jgi:hypothetical protein